jgi:hypothetical protein
MRSSLLPFLVTLLTVASPIINVRAQAVVASNARYVADGAGNTGLSGKAAKAAPQEMMVMTGKITNPAGVLPGAVVILENTKQMAVTNAEGEFEFVVPATAQALQARVTYAGFADEKMTLNSAAGSTASLTNAQVIVVSRRFQLKTYQKFARREVKRDLKQVRR